MSIALRALKYYINVPCGDILAGIFKYIMMVQINIYQISFYILQKREGERASEREREKERHRERALLKYKMQIKSKIDGPFSQHFPRAAFLLSGFVFKFIGVSGKSIGLGGPPGRPPRPLRRGGYEPCLFCLSLFIILKCKLRH